MNITILGAGAIGSLFGGLLAEAGHEIWLLDPRREHLRQIEAAGLWIEGASGNRFVRNFRIASSPAELENSAQIVFVFVKSTDTERAMLQSQEIFAAKPLVVSLQNGLGNIEKIAAVLGRKRLVAGTTSHGASMLGAGKIRHAGSGATVIGKVDTKGNVDLDALAGLLTDAGIQTHVSHNVISLIWDKLLVNVGINALTALSGLRNGQLLEFRETEEILETAVREAIQVAQALGIELSHDDPVSHTKEVCRLTAANTSSMLQDVQQKRTTEIEMMNGAIVHEGQRLGIATPVNRVLTNLLAVIEKNY